MSIPTPFRLHLDHDGISLHRGNRGEALLTTRLDAPDFDARLAEMRQAVLAETGPGTGYGTDFGTEPGTEPGMEPGMGGAASGGAPVAIVLPDSQILYTEVAASGLDDVADAARVRTGLVGATPYDLPELLWDWSPIGRVLRIAVVARETVEEAEHFANAHGFLPTTFLGGANDDAFPGQPRFDTGAGAAEMEAAAGDASADVTAAAAAAAGRAREHAGPGTADMPDAAMRDGSAEAAVRPMEPAPADHTAGASTERAAPVFTTEDAPAEAAAPGRAEGLQEPLAEERPKGAAQPETPGADTRPARGRSPDADAQEGPSAPETAVAAPFISHRAARTETDPGGNPPAGAVSPSDPADAAAPGPKRRGLSALRAPTGRSRPGPRAPTTEPTAPGKPAKGAAAPRLAAPNPSPMSAPAPEGPATGDTAPAPAPKLTTLAKASPPEDLPPPPARREIRRRSTGGVVPAPVGAAPTAETEMDEAASMTVFGARRAAPPRRGPRYLGLTLTFALLAVMGLVALWSLWFGEERPDPVASLPSAVQPAEDEAGTLARAVPLPEDATATPAPAPPSGAAVEGGSEAAPAITPLPDAPEPATVDIARTPLVPAPAPPAAAPAAASVAEAPAGPESGAGAGTPAPVVGPASGASSAAEDATAAPPDPQTAGSAAPSPAPANVAGAEILLDAPAAPTAPGASDEPALTTAALTPPGGATPTPIRLPDDRLPETARRDALPDMPENPLPPGSFLGPDGLVVPLPGGARAPGGYVLYTGPPPIIPPARPETDLPESDPAALPEAEAPDDDPAEAAPDDGASLLPEAAAPDPLVEARPLPRPADAAVLAAVFPGPTLTDETQGEPADIAAADAADEAAQASAPPDDDPADAVDAQETAPQDEAAVPDPALAGLRPRGRPAGLDAEAAALLEEAARAEAVAREEAAEAAAAAQAAEAQRSADIADASPLAVANAPEPRARPSNIAQLAARAQRSAPAEQERQAAARAAQTPESAAAPAPAPAAASTAAAAAPAPNAPIVRRSDRVQPAQPTSALVARQATQPNALRLNRVTLIGVYGSASQRRALVRLPSGRYVKVQVGDRLDGGVVSAISRDELQYTQGGRAVTIAMPSG